MVVLNKTFTFGVFCYNQEKYIIEHLESIKYQIENYAEDIDVSLVVGDDASKDATIKYIKIWLEDNKKIFKYITFTDYSVNKGVVGNYVSLLKEINTDDYKILAGDDLYFKNNIFIAQRKADLVLTPVVEFNENIVHKKHSDLKLIAINKDKRKCISKMIKYETFIEAPGVFLKKSLIDNGVYKVWGKYKWIEDVPLWNYLFNKDNITVAVHGIPLIMYRGDSGISYNSVHEKRKEFVIEEERIFKEICVYRNNYLYSLLYRLKNSILKRLCKYYYDKFDADMIAFNKNMAQAENEAAEYLALIRKNAEDFKARRGLK